MNQGYDLRVVCALVDQIKEGKSATEGLEPIDLSSFHDLLDECFVAQVVSE